MIVLSTRRFSWRERRGGRRGARRLCRDWNHDGRQGQKALDRFRTRPSKHRHSQPLCFASSLTRDTEAIVDRQDPNTDYTTWSVFGDKIKGEPI